MSILARLREMKRTHWANHTYLRRSRWESLWPAVTSVVSGPAVFFYPEYPHENYIIRKLCSYGGIEVTTDPQVPHDVGFYFTDKTFATSEEHNLIGPSFINRNCTDISKQNVQRVFEKVFQYSLGVDPTKYQGLTIEKSNQNAKHDGRIVMCPVEAPTAGKVYQKRIDNQVENDIFMDYRTTIIGESVPTVVCKYWRYEKGSMPGTVIKAEAARAHDVFSNGEVDSILQFAHAIGLDFGEVDVLRDKNDGHIYIVDANATPIGPREELSDSDYHAVLDRMLSAFMNQFIDR